MYQDVISNWSKWTNKAPGFNKFEAKRKKKKFHALQGTKPTLAADTVAVIMFNLVPMLEIFFMSFSFLV